MALTYTPDANLGSGIPKFKLKATDGNTYTDADFSQAQVLVVVFMCNHCPYVKAIEERLIDLGRDLKSKGGRLVGICSNDPNDYPEDSFEELKKRAELKNYTFEYLHDQDQAVAQAFGAVCTPDFFAFDRDQKLRYRGRLDDNWKDSTKVIHRELQEAVDRLLHGQPVTSMQNPSMGCSIKWIKGNK